MTTAKESYERNKKEQAYELSNAFCHILSFKEALSLSDEEILFLYKKLQEEEDEILGKTIEEILNGSKDD